MPAEPVVGWDIGGAHLKAAQLDPDGTVRRVLQLPCPLWQGLERLDAALDRALTLLGSSAQHAVTMTGEMVDLFASRSAGVTELARALGTCLGAARVRFYAGDRGFVEAEAVAQHAAEVASANWRASAQFVAASIGQALLVDVGSTTTDIVPLAGGRVLARGGDDAGRLAADELVYTGVVRTPVMALAPRVPFAGAWTPLMAEVFATSADVHRLTGNLPQHADQQPAADGGVKTPEASARRLARMIGRDLEAAPMADWERLARWLAAAQSRSIEDALARVESRAGLEPEATLVGAGVGRFVVREIARCQNRPYRDFASLLPAAGADADWICACAPAVAVACLALESA